MLNGRSHSGVRTESIYNKMSNKLYKYLCRMVQVLQYSIENNRTRAARTPVKDRLRDAHPQPGILEMSTLQRIWQGKPHTNPNRPVPNNVRTGFFIRSFQSDPGPASDH
jgi:hypothetical protein